MASLLSSSGKRGHDPLLVPWPFFLSSLSKRAASSSSCGLLVAAITRRRSSGRDGRPSNSTRNSVLRRRLASCSPSRRSDNRESTSSMKIIDGCTKSALTNFSPSPTYLEVRLAALMLKNVALTSVATALANKVLPLPGGPNNRRPLAGALKPVKSSGRRAGRTAISWRACLPPSWPAMSPHSTGGPPSSTSSKISCNWQ
ncbi:hypothetical protein J437_LFUL009732 [Ladona fulva]|uniref:Uncharacterized protein n=1 Tax=Ladona fulva TaxID=123851 RepID=A0A8K0KGG8_LADFU|nr:hypothetical protein J437_LFUL009732 [Ladona fulva]